MCGNKCSRRRISTLTAGQRPVETATQVQAYLVEKPDDSQSGLDSAENEVPPVHTEVWDEKGRSARDAAYGARSRAGHSGDVKGLQASVSGHDSRITTAAMAIFAWYMQRKEERKQRRLAYGHGGCCGRRHY